MLHSCRVLRSYEERTFSRLFAKRKLTYCHHLVTTRVEEADGFLRRHFFVFKSVSRSTVRLFALKLAVDRAVAADFEGRNVAVVAHQRLLAKRALRFITARAWL